MARIIAVGGGKGGIGKTTIVASLGVGLASFEQEVIIVDADLSGADLHLVMGIEKPQKTFYDFYNKEDKNLTEILLPHPQYENLKSISGVSGSLEIANLSYGQKMKYIRHLKRFDADFVILDLGAGYSYNVLDFFLTADQGIVVVKPDPLSIHESYHFVKLAIFRKIINLIRADKDAGTIVQQLNTPDSHQKHFSLNKIVREVGKLDPAVAKIIRHFLRTFHPKLLINELKNSEDEKNCLKVKAAAENTLGITMEYIGAIRWDDTVPKSLDQMTPFINYDVGSRASKDLLNIISKNILSNGDLTSVREKYAAKKKIKQVKAMTKSSVICSVRCSYWATCNYRDGGYPCMLYPIVSSG